MLHYWTGHAHSWELAVWWICIAAPIAVAGWRLRPSRRADLARIKAETAHALRELHDAALADDTDDHDAEVDAR